MCQYIGIVQAAVAAITVVAPLDVVKTGLYDQMKAEGIWGRGSEWGSDEEAEVKRVRIIWFAKKIIWGSIEASVLLQVFYRLTVRLEEWQGFRI